MLPCRMELIMITLDAASRTPPFEQVRAQIATQIGTGVLTPGTRLPPVRRLADDLGLAANTVARAYRDLEVAGLVETRGRGGTIVTAGGNRARERLQAAAQRYATLAHDLAVAPDEALRLVRTALDPTSGVP
jgi:DNA-binding transcriptional regulator YhcF (GntR family)